VSAPAASTHGAVEPLVGIDLGDLRRLERELAGTPGRAAEAFRRHLAQPRWYVEAALVLGLYGLYSLVRNSVGDVSARAYANATSILRFEEAWGVAPERWMNRWVTGEPLIAHLVALEYATLHFIVTVGVLVWLFRRRRSDYRLVSGVLLVTTATALLFFYATPTAPPRLLPAEGFVDVMSQTSAWGWWPASGAPGPDAVSNQFAAMPSLHCAWATWAGLVLLLFARRAWVRALGVLYLPVTYFVVMGSGNHFLLDVVAGVALVAAVTLLAGWAAQTLERVPTAPVP
jgi:hypothetical protein